MPARLFSPVITAALLGASLLLSVSRISGQNRTVTIDWKDPVRVSKTTPTLQVVVNPMLRTGSPIHKGSFEALANLGSEYTRFVPWFPYPKMAVAELQPPTKDSTFWDFSAIDPIVNDFMEATKGHSVVLNFSTIPVWMFKTDAKVEYPSDPEALCWSYNGGTQLRDTSFRELTGYYVRLFSWFTKGGFTDELGKFHSSGHYYKIPYWEVLNEPDLEHDIPPALYTNIYDAIVTELKKVSPGTKFIGISLAFTSKPEWFEYFLNPAHHRPGIPLEGISYHFYGTKAAPEQNLDSYQYSFFDQAAGFLDKVRYIESIRKRLAPQTFTTINEIGNILEGSDYPDTIPVKYWNLSGAMYAWIYLELTKIGIDVAGESQLVGYPTQFPDVSTMDWKNGKPNSRYWVLKLLKDNFGPGDQLVTTASPTSDVAAQAFITAGGKKLLLINKRNKTIRLELPVAGVRKQFVNASTGEEPYAAASVIGNSIDLQPFEVAVVAIPASGN